MDQAHAHGTHTLRWDLLSARVPGGILHAKVSVLVWAAHVRVIVASANLTEPGYRSNREIFGVLNYYEGGTAPLSVLHELLSFLAQTARQCVEPSSARERWADVLKLARSKAQSWGSEQPGMVRAVLSGLGQADTLTQLSKDVWPLKRPPTFARVGSPFFDLNPGDNAPARRLWELLDQRIAEVQWEVAGRIESAKPPVVYLKLPGTIRNAQPTGSSQTFCLVADHDEGEEPREFHAKWLWLENANMAVYLIGSANFTSAGLGLSSRPNIEAGLAYIARTTKEISALKAMSINSVAVDETAELKFDPTSNQDEDCEGRRMLPLCFGSAVFAGVELRLSFHADAEVPEDWEARMNSADGRLLATDTLWRSAGSPAEWDIPWDDTHPPSVLAVNWPGLNQVVWWPVTLENAAALPPPEELRHLGLERLIEILASRQPLQRVIKNQKKRKERQAQTKNGPLDAHDLVKTDQHLLPRSRRVNAALAGLRWRLEQPAAAPEVLAWRLGHPVGAMALADALQNEAGSAEERVFLLTELMLELGHVKLPAATPDGCLTARMILAELVRHQRQLWQQIETNLTNAADAALAAHAQAAKEYLKL